MIPRPSPAPESCPHAEPLSPRAIRCRRGLFGGRPHRGVCRACLAGRARSRPPRPPTPADRARRQRIIRLRQTCFPCPDKADCSEAWSGKSQCNCNARLAELDAAGQNPTCPAGHF